MTDRKLRELALQALLEDSADLVLGLDGVGAVTSAGSASWRLLGLEAGALLGTGFRDLILPL